MKQPWRKWRKNRVAIAAAIAVGIMLLALPLAPSLRRYAVMESM